VINLAVPPLRERREDIAPLARHFLEIFSKKNTKDIKGFTPQAMDRLIRYPWPGNVRELMNTIESAVVLSSAQYLQEEDLALVYPSRPPGEPAEPMAGLSLDEVERTAILAVLSSVGGNKSEASRKLGITRATLHKKLKRYGME
jgi:two-component system response regulator HydG